VADLNSINADNTALVHVTVTVPADGARQGQAVDAHIAAINGAKSLRGGRLVLCPMFGPMGPVGDNPVIYALADGAVELEDVTNPAVGLIKGAAIFEQDIVPQYVTAGRITVVVDSDHASWALASALATVINDAESEPGRSIATAINPGNVVVAVPTPELADPADFIARVLGLPVLMPDRQARIVINERTGTIVITDDVEIDPVIISHPGLTIATVTPEPLGTPEAPLIRTTGFVPMDPAAKGGASLKSLLDAFNQLEVPAKDRIEIIRKLKRTGRLHATVIEE
jgi:flagellar P-ring protein precursor FlgI